jgi:hypothetical protein
MNHIWENRQTMISAASKAGIILDWQTSNEMLKYNA